MIEAVYSNQSFYIMLGNLDIHTPVIPMKFDTGAINTVISLGALTASKVDIPRLSAMLHNQTSHKRFRSASGDEMDGFLVRAEHIILGGSPFDYLFYYLLTNTDYSIGLLGNDFITKCEFVHKIDSNINILSFDKQNYLCDSDKYIGAEAIDHLISVCSLS